MKALGIILTILFIRTTSTVELREVPKPIDNTPTHMLSKVKKKHTFTKKESKEIINTLNKYKEDVVKN